MIKPDASILKEVYDMIIAFGHRGRYLNKCPDEFKYDRRPAKAGGALSVPPPLGVLGDLGINA